MLRRLKGLFKDTIATRIAVTIPLVVVTAISFDVAFTYLGGPLAKPSLLESGVIDQAVVSIRLIDAAPAEARPRLAQAASSPVVIYRWFRDEPIIGETNINKLTNIEARWFRKFLAQIGGGDRRIMARPHDRADERQVRVVAPDLSVEGLDFMMVEMTDHTWLVVTGEPNQWGMGPVWRRVLRIGFLAIATILVTAWTTRRLARPIEAFAEAANRFTIDSAAPPIPARGPVEIKVAIAAFNSMQARIRKFVDDRVLMLAAMSHDIRTPLTRLRLRAELMADTELQAKVLRDIDDMQAMAEATLAFLRDGAGDEEMTTIDLPILLQDLVDEASDAGHEASYHGPAHSACRGQPNALRRAFQNLVDNAIKYGRKAEVILRTVDATTVVTIRDEGPGVAEELHEQIFAPFFRVETSRNPDSGGFGLGLTVARSIIRAHGGDIVPSHGDIDGLVLTVTLPTGVSG